MDPLLIYSPALQPDLLPTIQEHGYEFTIVSSVEEASVKQPPDGWSGAIISTLDNKETAYELCRFLRETTIEAPLQPLLIIVKPETIKELEVRDNLFDEFLVESQIRIELAARLRHRFWHTGRGTHPDLIEYGDLVLNLETYQARIRDRSLDLTYMEYELLKFFSTRPGKVFTREILLSRVWGYDYYGGARTVDVHVRRLRAKLGEEYASYITTVRSVGYRFGTSKWGM